MIVVFVCKLDIDKEDILLDKMSLLSYEEKSKINRFRFEKDRYLSFLGKAMAASFALDYKKFSDGEVVYLNDLSFISDENLTLLSTYTKDDCGKPYFKDREDVYFNISHSGTTCVCAVGDENIGIDIQEFREIKTDFAKRYFNQKDNDYLAGIGNTTRDILKVWSIKESFVKLDGRGMSYGMNKFYGDYEKNEIIDNNGNSIAQFKKIFENETEVCYLAQYSFKNTKNS